MIEIINRIQYSVLLAVFLLSYLIILPIKLQMIMYTLPIIYIGSHLSLIQDSSKKTDTMTKKDAILFPFIGSASLLTLYLGYKYLGPWFLNLLVSSYVSLIGISAFGLLFDEFLCFFAPSLRSKGFRVSLPPFLARLTEFPSVLLNLSVFFAVFIGISFFHTKHYILHNLLATCLGIQGIRSVSLGSFAVGLVLLWGLFVYDVFWVFGSDVMVTVAKNFDAPIKLVLPLGFEPWKSGLLGLGDVVVPGLFIAMCLRFDRSSSKHVCSSNSSSSGSKNSSSSNSQGDYIFWSSYIGYLVGLVVTGIVMLVFNAAQPALLYLVPAVTGSAVLAAWSRGQLTQLFNYNEDHSLDNKIQ